MRFRLATLISFVSIALLGAGCAGGRISFNYYDHEPKRTRVTHVYRHADHVCSHDCHDHYWDGTRVLVLKGHRHHRDCGHIWDGGHWVVARQGRVEPVHSHVKRVKRVKHVHGHKCGCAYNRRAHKWIKVKKGHVHRRGCGHVHIDGRWTIRF